MTQDFSPAEEFSEEVELTTGPIYITENGAKFVVAGEDGDEVAVPVQIAEVGTLSPYVAWMIIGTDENLSNLTDLKGGVDENRDFFNQNSEKT